MESQHRQDPIPPDEPHGIARVVAIYQHYYGELTLEQLEDPTWDPGNNIH
jgi:hypothetical protein